MTEQTDKVLAQLIQRASDGIDAAVSFSQAQLPDVIHQLLVWNFTRSLLMTVIALASIPLMIWFIRSQVRRRPDGVVERGCSWEVGRPRYVPTLVWDNTGDLSPLSFLLAVAVGFWALFVLRVVIDATWLEIWLAPKLYLIEYAAQLIK